MIPQLELTILQSLINNEQFTRKVLPYIKDAYFETSIGCTFFQQIAEYFVQYGSCPTKESLAIGIEKLEGINEEEFRSLNETFPLLFDATPQDTDFITNSTENWCKERAVYLVLL